MPSRKQVEALEHICFMKMARIIHNIATQLEEQPDSCKVSAEELSSMVSSLPAVINENMIVKVIETIHKTFSRTRKTIGMKTCLEVLLQPHVQRVNLNGLFFKMRLQGTINTTIRSVVYSHVASMRNLMTLNMVSKCSDEILCVLGEKCPEISEVNISISDLVTDKGLKALAKGCPKLENLGIYKCWIITAEGIAYVLKYSKNLKKLKCDQLGAVLISEFSDTRNTFKLTHFEQTHMLFEPKSEDVRWVGDACPNLESVSLYVDDRNLALVPLLGRIRQLYHSVKAWLTVKISSDWFYRHFVKEVVHFQRQTVGIPHDQVKALLLLDNAPAHPSERELVVEGGRIRILEIETKAGLGDGFIEAIKYLGNSLQTLQLNCNQVQQKLLVVLGECCPGLTTLHLSTAAIEGDELLSNPGQLFSDLTVLHLQVWEESVLSNKFVDFFLMWCHKLESVLLKAEVGFLTDQYLDSLLAANPLKEAKYIVIASDEFVPLTLRSVYKLMSSCPALENLGISSWDIDEEQFFTLREMFKINNYNLTIS